MVIERPGLIVKIDETCSVKENIIKEECCESNGHSMGFVRKQRTTSGKPSKEERKSVFYSAVKHI